MAMFDTVQWHQYTLHTVILIFIWGRGPRSVPQFLEKAQSAVFTCCLLILLRSKYCWGYNRTPLQPNGCIRISMWKGQQRHRNFPGLSSVSQSWDTAAWCISSTGYTAENKTAALSNITQASAIQTAEEPNHRATHCAAELSGHSWIGGANSIMKKDWKERRMGAMFLLRAD